MVSTDLTPLYYTDAQMAQMLTPSPVPDSSLTVPDNLAQIYSTNLAQQINQNGLPQGFAEGGILRHFSGGGPVDDEFESTPELNGIEGKLPHISGGPMGGGNTIEFGRPAYQIDVNSKHVDDQNGEVLDRYKHSFITNDISSRGLAEAVHEKQLQALMKDHLDYLSSFTPEQMQEMKAQQLEAGDPTDIQSIARQGVSDWEIDPAYTELTKKGGKFHSYNDTDNQSILHDVKIKPIIAANTKSMGGLIQSFKHGGLTNLGADEVVTHHLANDENSIRVAIQNDPHIRAMFSVSRDDPAPMHVSVPSADSEEATLEQYQEPEGTTYLEDRAALQKKSAGGRISHVDLHDVLNMPPAHYAAGGHVKPVLNRFKQFVPSVHPIRYAHYRDAMGNNDLARVRSMMRTR